MRADVDDGRAAPTDELSTTALGTDLSPLAVLEGTMSLLAMDRYEVGTPLGDLEAVTPC